MTNFLFKQLDFVRSQTVKALQDVSEEQAMQIPDGFRNSILWQAGHIYLVQERFAFLLQGLEAQLPDSFMGLFGPGSSPLSWEELPPKLSTLIGMLSEQPSRIEPAVKDYLSEKLASPYTTKSGMTLETVGEFVNFTLYHEGMHFQAIKMYKTKLGVKP